MVGAKQCERSNCQANGQRAVDSNECSACSGSKHHFSQRAAVKVPICAATESAVRQLHRVVNERSRAVLLTILWLHRSTRALQTTTTAKGGLLSEQKMLAGHGEGASRRWWYSIQGSRSVVGHAHSMRGSDLKLETGCEGCVRWLRL